MSTNVSIIILTHNGVDATRWCLTGLSHTAYDNVEVVFVDNGSTDETLAVLRDAVSEDPVRRRLIENDSNVGCSTARNRGAADARGEFLVFLDNDVVVRTRRWVDILLETFADAGVGAASPKLVYPSPPHPIQFAGGAVSPSGKVQFMGRGKPRNSLSVSV